jgi:hypothetical protein
MLRLILKSLAATGEQETRLVLPSFWLFVGPSRQPAFSSPKNTDWYVVKREQRPVLGDEEEREKGRKKRER